MCKATRLEPRDDPWDPQVSRREGRHRLTSVEVTVTNRCNMRCRHCAVGERLMMTDPEPMELSLLLSRLDEVDSLRTLSITGGEPSENMQTVREYVLPILCYARDRGLVTQVNTNLTMPLERYELIARLADVLHISWNYLDVADFHRIAWGHGRERVSLQASEQLFNRMVANTKALTGAGHFLSAESMINRETAPHLGAMNQALASMGCRRHEVHPMYPVDFAADLPVLNLDELRVTVDHFLDERDPNLWVLFGTFPFIACSPLASDRSLLAKARSSPNITIRNCPDGRSRVNVNLFSGEAFVTDFAEIPALGNIATDSFETIFQRWQQHEAFAPFNCYCPEAGCTGPNLIVANVYHPGVDFRTRSALA